MKPSGSYKKTRNNFVGIFVQTMKPKGHFEINWPLTTGNFIVQCSGVILWYYVLSFFLSCPRIFVNDNYEDNSYKMQQKYFIWEISNIWILQDSFETMSGQNWKQSPKRGFKNPAISILKVYWAWKPSKGIVDEQNTTRNLAYPFHTACIEF